MFTTHELKELHRLVSVARLSSYSRYLGTSTASEAYGAYMWSAAVSAAFTPLVQAVEVGLRNSLQDALSPVYGINWFEQWVINEANHLRAVKKLPHGQQSEGERLIKKAKEKVRRRDDVESKRKGLGSLPHGYAPSWQGVLAELSFGFWARFLTRWYWDINHKAKLWPNHLAAVFPGAPKLFYAVGAAHQAFNKAVDMRNRIHHQEPLWKHYTVTSIDDAIRHLSDQLTQTLMLLDCLGPSKKAALIKYGVVASIQELCTKESFFRFTGQQHGNYKRLMSAKKDLRLIAKNIKDHQSLWLVTDGLSPQLIVRNANRRFF